MSYRKIRFFILVLSILTTQLMAAQISGGNPNTTDCVGSILICGNTEIGITPSGPGADEFTRPGNPPPTCLNFGMFSQAWFRVEFETAGTFAFVIDPDNGVADYDFAVFGPTTDCDNLGAAIRCSSTNPDAAGVPAATGLNETSTDVQEGPGSVGDGFLRQLDVQAGETYYIVVALAVGSGGFSISASGTAQFPQAAVANDVPDIVECDDEDDARDGFKNFDFSTLDDAILDGQPNAVVSYHESLNDANQGIDALTFPYRNIVNPQQIFVRVERTDSECTDFNNFTVTVDDSDIETLIDPIILCSQNLTEVFDFDTVIDDLVPNNEDLTVTYHNSFEDAQNNANARGSLFIATRNQQNVFIKVSDPLGEICDAILNVPFFISQPPAAINPSTLQICDDDFDGLVDTQVTSKTPEILNGLDPNNHNVNYYQTAQDRDAANNEITTINNATTGQVVYARVTQLDTQCIIDVQFEIQVNPRPILQVQDPVTYCLNSATPQTLTVESGFSFYEWSTGESGPDLNSIEVTTAGDFTVNVTNEFGCQSLLIITVIPSDVATVNSIDVDDFNNGDNSAVINVSGPGDYEFAVDDQSYQDSNVFRDLDSGFHTLRVRDKNGCGVTILEFSVLDFEPFFTPNADGFNDTWTLRALSDYPDARLLIYDRFGKLLKQVLPDSQGWDGTFNGEPLPSSTYWFSLEIPDRPVVKGYFAMKR
jgi:gliding motility-associated-like protein